MLLKAEVFVEELNFISFLDNIYQMNKIKQENFIRRKFSTATVYSLTVFKCINYACICTESCPSLICSVAFIHKRKFTFWIDHLESFTTCVHGHTMWSFDYYKSSKFELLLIPCSIVFDGKKRKKSIKK